MSNQPLDRDRITQLTSTIFAEDLHAKRVASLAGAAVGVLEGAALGIHAIGSALAVAEGLKGKHAVKQVDRLLSNKGIRVWDLFASWVPHIVGDWPEVVTALDWTDFDAAGVPEDLVRPRLFSDPPAKSQHRLDRQNSTFRERRSHV